LYIRIRNPQGGGADISLFSEIKEINQCSVSLNKGLFASATLKKM